MNVNNWFVQCPRSHQSFTNDNDENGFLSGILIDRSPRRFYKKNSDQFQARVYSSAQLYIRNPFQTSAVCMPQASMLYGSVALKAQWLRYSRLAHHKITFTQSVHKFKRNRPNSEPEKSMQLVINSPGTLITQKDECFRLKCKEQILDISPVKVESIVISNQAMISTQAISKALEHNIDIIFLDAYGDPVGRIWYAKMGSTGLIRRKQIEAAENLLGLELVTDMIGQKMENQIHFLKRLMHARPGRGSEFTGAVEIIQAALVSLKLANSHTVDQIRNELMGLEGTAGRAYFQCISGLLPEKYRFSGRSRRPAKDPFNAVLNYCYGILYSRVEKACILSGLDPYVGFLHTDNYNKKSMVFDLIEPFRIFAEQTAVYLFTGKQMKDECFDISQHAVSLNTKGKPVVIEALNKFMDDTVRYRRKNVKRKYIIQHEAHRMANILLGDTNPNRPDWLEIKEI